MNPGVIVIMIMLACWPAPVRSQQAPLKPIEQPASVKPPEPSFEQRWRPELDVKVDEMIARQNPVKTFRVTKQVEGMIPGAAPILPTHAFIKAEGSGEGAGNSGARPTGVERAKTEIVGRTVPSPLPSPKPAVRSIRKASLDICARHGMRRVDYGRTWRCRR